ncbi:HD domain-containing protein [Bailinhaonella thermotolerans]|uniref:HD domain-containing protein n=1 Tax=Bailinhaonella thermotolerans TaxID=1070861 RepID=A0A3A4AJV6_9ACTN|nr:HD domain-containing protein [Bailinhaonella thermotolerans]RJL29936.1 HD domain-containing protein [Bailinhaonella thermotolerans]
MTHVLWARDLAARLLDPLPRRLAHVTAVGRRAGALAPILGPDAELLAAAAYLHDIGYAPAVADTGFHPLDGARYLREVEKADDRLCRLVAHHSCAVYEARERDLLATLLAEFTPERADLAEALTFCDMTTGPDGVHLTAEDRLAEIRSRYGPGHLVTRSITRATPCILHAVQAVHERLAAAGVRLPPDVPADETQTITESAASPAITRPAVLSGSWRNEKNSTPQQSKTS